MSKRGYPKLTIRQFILSQTNVRQLHTVYLIRCGVSFNHDGPDELGTQASVELCDLRDKRLL